MNLLAAPVKPDAIAQARAALEERLDEIRRRAQRVRSVLDPVQRTPDPLVRLAMAAGVGFLLGLQKTPGPVVRLMISVISNAVEEQLQSADS